MATVEDKLDALSAQMTFMLQMMEEANAGMCRTLRTSAAASRLSAPSSSPAPPVSSTPAAVPKAVAPPSTTARTAAPTTITTMLPGVIDKCSVVFSASIDAPAEPTAAPTSSSTPTALRPAPRSATTTSLGAIDERAVTWCFGSKHATVIPAAHPRATTPSTASPTVAVLDVNHWSPTPTAPTATSTIVHMATTVRPLPTPASAISSTEDDAINTSPTRCSTTRLCRSTNMLVSGSSVNTISTVPPSSATHTLAKQVAAPAVGMSQYAHQVLQVTSTSYYPFSVNHGKCYDLVMLWPPPVSHARNYSAPCVFDRGKNKRGKWIVNANVQEAPKVFAGMTNMSPEMLAPLPATLVDKGPWPPPLKDGNSLLTDTYLLCLHSGQPFNSGQIDVTLRQPRPPPLLIDLMDSDGPLKSTPWPSFYESAAALHLQNSSALELAISLTAVQTLSVSGKALDSITLLPTLCSRASDGLYQLKTVISYTNSYILLFSFSQYASLLLHSGHCYHQPVQWKPPWISLLYIFSNRPNIVCSLRIRTATMPHLFWWSVVAKLQFCDVQYRNLLGEGMGLCLYFRYLVSQLLHIVPSPRLMICIASAQYSQTIFRICVPQAIPLFSFNHTPVVFSYIEGLHHDSIIPRIISPVSTMSGKRCYRQNWKPPWASLVCKVITWKFLARVRNLQSSGTVVTMLLGLIGMKLMTDYECATELSLFEQMLIFSEEMAVLKFANHLCESSRISELFLFQKITSAAWDAGDMQLSHGIYMVVTLYIFRKWTVTSNFDGKVILLCVSKVRKLLGVNQIDAKLILHWAEYTKNHIFLFGSEHISLVTSCWSTKSIFQIILCMEYFCCSSLGLCHIQITNQQEAGDKDCSFTQSALSHHSVIKRVEYTSASSRIFTCISKTVNCLPSVRFHFYNLMIEDP